MPLSEPCVAQLSRMYKRWVPAQVCSECNKPPGEMNGRAPHALQEEYDKIKKDKSIKPSQKKALLLEVNKILNNSSRCCGADLTVVYCDYFEVLYERWVHRYDNHLAPFVNKPVIDDKTKKELMPSFRKAYGIHQQYYDDDFIMMHVLFGLGDSLTGELIKIFREEDIRQEAMKQQSEVVEVDKESPPSYENDFLDWIENVA